MKAGINQEKAAINKEAVATNKEAAAIKIGEEMSVLAMVTTGQDMAMISMPGKKIA
jgi:hypothetical protein